MFHVSKRGTFQAKKKNLLIFDGFGIKLHSIFILLSLKVLISFPLHFFTFLDEEHKNTFLCLQEQYKHYRIVKVMTATSVIHHSNTG